MSLGGASENDGKSYEEEYKSIYDSLNSLLQDYKDDVKKIYDNRNDFQRVANNEIIGELESFKQEILDDVSTVNFIISADDKYYRLSEDLQEKFINLRSKYIDLQALVQRYISLKKQRNMAATRNAKNIANKKAKNNAKANKLKRHGIAEKRETKRK